MGRHDTSKWAQNEDGSWSRTVNGNEETSPVNPEPPKATTGAIEVAEELGVDLTAIEGSGHAGKITKADVEAAVAG